MSDNIIKTKTFQFAIKIVNLHQGLVESRKEYVLSKQILRSGTSIAANVREGINAQSKSDFIHKFSICQKEADETLFWLELLQATNYIKDETFNELHSECMAIMKIITKIIITTKNNSKL